MSDKNTFEMYKFLGDGWILLFDEKVNGHDLMDHLKTICHTYKEIFHDKICSVLEGNDHLIGVTMGVEVGPLLRFVMNGKAEYVGRALNVAARLQGAVKGIEPTKLEGKLLISNNAYEKLGLFESTTYTGKVVKLSLRNIVGGATYQARRIILVK
jgi:class 3 adenylate cyclase